MMKIYSTNSLYKINDNKQKQDKKQSSTASASVQQKTELRSQFNDHLLSFGARVDKGLERFYDANKDRMPSPVRRYIENLDDKTRLTPMEAQKRAFQKLETAETVKEVKKAFDGDQIFDNLIEPKDSKAKRGILNSVKENEELLALSEQGVLKTKEDLTVYLVKKVFLEAKTIEEINKDLENDLDPDFKADFKFKNPDSPYVYGTTLKALGIQMPEFEYQQSLRYTRDGYADSVGEKISQGQRAFWDSLDDTERTARAKKSVEKMETWWNSLTKNQKLDMIADQLTELDMLKLYKKEQRAQAKQNPKETQKEKEAEESRKHTKVGSETLSKDELFLKWASNNLKLYEANLSEADKDTLHVKRMQRLVSRWADMSPSERTDYISKMKAGSEPLRYSMIDAWNHSTDLIKDLSMHLRANQIYKPADLLYSTQEFSTLQSQIMTEFWQNHPDYAKDLGNKIVESQQKVQTAISRGTFEELKKQIMRDKNQRQKFINSEMEKFKNNIQNPAKISANKADKPQYKKDFKDAYNAHIYGKVKSMPKNFYTDMYDTTLDVMPESAVKIWTKNLRGEQLSQMESIIIKSILKDELPQIARYNRALEAAMADTLYEYTNDASVYEMSNSDVKMAMYHLERNESPIILDSHKIGKRFTLHIRKEPSVNPQKINSLYEHYKKDLTDNEAEDIIKYYFTIDNDKLAENEKVLPQILQDLKEYIKTYGKSALILFSDKSDFSPEIKNAFNKKFIQNMPDRLKEQKIVTPCLNSLRDIQDEMKMKQAHLLLSKRFNFVPDDLMKDYMKEVSAKLRKDKSISADTFIARGCQKRKNSTSTAGIVFIPKRAIDEKTKLKLLAFEQAMADVLFESTGNEEVYALGFEDLCDNMELFSMLKSFPTQERIYRPSGSDKTVTICAKKKLNTTKLYTLYRQYSQELNEWAEENKNTEKPDIEDLLFILNPDENQPLKDIQIAKRMAGYDYNIEKITIYPDTNLYDS